MDQSWSDFFKGGFNIMPEEMIEKKMNDTYNNKYYTELRNNNYTTILGIWDDNDFGVNDGESDNPIKHQQKLRFLNLIEEPKDSLRWKKA